MQEDFKKQGVIHMPDNPQNKGMKTLIIIAVIVVILVVAYLIYHYSGVMNMFNPILYTSYLKELIG